MTIDAGDGILLNDMLSCSKGNKASAKGTFNEKNGYGESCTSLSVCSS